VRSGDAWGLACPVCEGYLRSDPLWSAEIDRIPETLDEVQAREALARRGPRDAYAILAAAMGQLLGADTSALPGTVSRGAPGPARVAGMVTCPAAGHVQAAGMRFCGQCGSAMHGAVPAAAITGAGAAA
jgi:hypothetical protein